MLPEYFSVTNRDCRARTGLLSLPHGEVHTPLLMPVGSQGTVKGVLPEQLAAAGVEMILANSYHLMLRPGVELIERVGGLHSFMGWQRPILTDSGGFQVFSLPSLREVSDEGVHFRSHIDGSSRFLTPEGAVRCQGRLGSDIAMVLDEVPGFPCERREAENAVKRTLLWAERSIAASGGSGQFLFGIVQGSVWEDLRRNCAEKLSNLPFAGYAIGGVSVGESREQKGIACEISADCLPEDKPRYLMGVGEPEDVLPAVGAGVDMFDCVIPTRCARNGRLYTWSGPVNIRNARFREKAGPLEAGCGCRACRGLSAAYLHHLYAREELLAPVLGTLHNLDFFQRLFSSIRKAIERGEFREFQQDFLAEFKGPGQEGIRC